MGDQMGEEILPAGKGGWNVIIMECRLGRDIEYSRGLHKEMLEDWRTG